MGAWNPSSASDKNAEQAQQQINNTGTSIQQQSALSPQASQQWQGSYGIGNYLQQLYGSQVGMNAAPAGATSSEQQYQNQGPLSQSVYNQTLAQAQNPTAGWQSTLQPQLQQAQNQINEYYNSRGLMDSGIAIGASQDAGIDLAIQNAQNEMAYQQQSLQNAGALSSNISTLNQQNSGNLQSLYNSQQGYGLQNQQLAQQGFQEGAGYQAYPAQAQLGSFYGSQAAEEALPGQLIGAAGSLGAAAMLCWVASEIFGGWYEPKTILARNWVTLKSPKWFKDFYIKNGKSIANFIHNKPILKNILKPLFELFAKWGK